MIKPISINNSEKVNFKSGKNLFTCTSYKVKSQENWDKYFRTLILSNYGQSILLQVKQWANLMEHAIQTNSFSPKNAKKLFSQTEIFKKKQGLSPLQTAFAKKMLKDTWTYSEKVNF